MLFVEPIRLDGLVCEIIHSILGKKEGGKEYRNGGQAYTPHTPSTHQSFIPEELTIINTL